MEKTLSVAAIENGTVIDHIDAHYALAIIRLLNLPEGGRLVTVGLNLPSKHMGTKDLIKVEGREITEEEANRIAILSPTATINVIKKYVVGKKFTVSLPKTIDHVIVCPNSMCISNNERMMNTKFHVFHNGTEVRLKCHYCEKGFSQTDIKEYNH
jgi:aspartate carbamoyltransferase regulatory subunit